MTAFDLTPLEHGSLTERTVEVLLDRIVTRGLEPGTSLPSVAVLAESLGVSRPVVREALNALKALGIIDIANGKKAVIRDLDGEVLRIFFRRALQIVDDSVREVMEVRTGIEIRAAALAARNRSDLHLAVLKALVGRMEAAVDEAAAFARHDSAFHLAIAEASGNRLIFHVVESLEAALRNASYQGVRAITEHGRVHDVIDEHRAIVAAIEDRDEARAAALMHDHIAAAMTRMGIAA
ncbi:FadR/GntR family transcriptional regulator [Pinisolibacter sp.]|uniref:FadR/GntR family transcriptional regulator n=1 Tax=Pinisolibacter sp. TaxID=2172024 RepID=UPI002FDDB862